MWTAALRKSWIHAARLYDKFFAFAEGGAGAVRWLRREIITFYLPEKPAKKKPPSLLPGFDVLEARLVPIPTVATAVLPSADPHNVGIPIGETNVDLNLGAVRVEQALHFDLDGCGCQDMLAGPALTYNSVTVGVQPIFQVTVSPNGTIPTAIKARLTWAGGTPQNWVTLTPANSNPIVMRLQSSSLVGQTGRYDWLVNFEVDYAGSDPWTDSASGRASVVVNDSSVTGQIDPFGAGYGIRGVDRLVSVSDGLVWVYGTGDSDFFASSGGAYTSPPGNFGTLTGNSTIGYTYTANGQIQEKFDSNGLMTSVKGTDNFTTTYAYDSGSRLTKVVAGDGSTATLAYDSTNHLLQTITEPGGRTLTVAESASGGVGRLTQLVDAAGNTRTMAYDSTLHLTSDAWSPYSSAFGYDTTTGRLNNVDLGSGTTYGITPAVTRTGVTPTQGAQGIATDALTHATTYDLDTQGRMLTQYNPAAESLVWQRDSNGMVTASVDGNGYTTTHGYDSYGQLTSEVVPNGRSFTYTRDHSTGGVFYDRVTLAVENGATTTNSYDSSGQLTQTVDPHTHTTTYAWSNKRMTQKVDPTSATTNYAYDSYYRLTKVVNPDSDTMTTTYDNNGNISTTIDGDHGANPHTTSYTYDANNQLTAQTNPAGDSAAYTYNAAGFQTSSVVGGITHTQAFDTRGWRTLSTDGNGYTTQYQYDKAGRMTAVIDPNAHTTQQSFDADGRVTQTIDPTSVTTSQKYDNSGNVTQTIGNDGSTTFTTSYYYDRANHLTQTIDPDNHTMLESYDTYGRQTQTIDGAGNTTQQVYDTGGLVTATIDGNLTTTQMFYDGDNRVTQTVVDVGVGRLNLTTSQYYDAAGYVTATADPDSQMSTQYYDTFGNVTAAADPGQHTVLSYYDGDNRLTKTVRSDTQATTQQQYDSASRVTKTIDADNYTSTTSFDGNSNVTLTVNGANNTTQHAYDPANNLTQTIETISASVFSTTQYSYDAANRRTSTIDADGHTATQSYDYAGRLTKTTDFGGRTTSFYYDGAGLTTKTVDGNTYTTLQYYDGDNRLTKTVDGDSHATSTAYDPGGRVTLTTDANTHTRQTKFDAASRVTATIDGGNHTMHMYYDPAGNETAVVDANGTGTTQYAYDVDNRLTQVTDAVTNVTTYSLDGDGNITQIVSPNGFTTTQKFDGNGQMTQVITPDTLTVNYTYDGAGRKLSDGNGTFTYDGAGRMTGASNNNGTYAFSYDLAHRLTQVTEPFGLSLGYSYDNAGNQTQVLDSKGGTTVSTYDSDNFLTRRTYQGQSLTFRFDFSNNQEGWNTTLTRYTDLNGTTLVAKSVYGYDSVGQVTSVLSTDPTGATINKFVYSLDSADRLTSETDTQNGATTTTSYTYDNDGQLTGAGTLTYGYDANGNRNTGSYTVTTGNQMSADANWSYSYDKEGNLKEKDSKTTSEKWTYTYSANNLLTEADHYNTGGTLDLTVDYKYDAFGEQIEEDVGAGNLARFARFGIDGWNSNMASPIGNENRNVWARLDSTSSLINRYLWGDHVDQQLGRIDLGPATPYWTLQDRLGSIRDVINNSGLVKDDIQYDAFGNINLATETNSAYRGWYAYSGREFDTEINLQYNHARWYDATMGRWISEDPLGFDAGDSNLYRYVNNGPTIATDPSGLQEVLAGPASLKLSVTSAAEVEVDGNFVEANMRIAWLPQGVVKGGFVIQHVKIIKDYTRPAGFFERAGVLADRPGLPVLIACLGSPRKRVTETYELWEAWEVDSKGTVYKGYKANGLPPKNVLGPVHDSFRVTIRQNTLFSPWGIFGADTEGTVQVVGYARYVEGYKVNWRPGGAKFSGSLPSTNTRPEGWTDDGGVKHGYILRWDNKGKDASPHNFSITESWK
jgi:RHS repeat-associated protein